MKLQNVHLRSKSDTSQWTLNDLFSRLKSPVSIIRDIVSPTSEEIPTPKKTKDLPG